MNFSESLIVIFNFILQIHNASPMFGYYIPCKDRYWSLLDKSFYIITLDCCFFLINITDHLVDENYFNENQFVFLSFVKENMQVHILFFLVDYRIFYISIYSHRFKIKSEFILYSTWNIKYFLSDFIKCASSLNVIQFYRYYCYFSCLLN